MAKENLGTWAGLLAAAALMIDYVLNVAVGISAGVAALVSAAPALHHYTLPLCLGVLARHHPGQPARHGRGGAGVRPADVPVHRLHGRRAGLGVVQAVASGGPPAAGRRRRPPCPRAAEAVGLWLLLRAFASGCTAMTGVEAVSNGVSAFREPTVDNAHRTLTVIVVVLAVLLGGIAYLVRATASARCRRTSRDYQSVLSQLTAAVVGRGLVLLRHDRQRAGDAVPVGQHQLRGLPPPVPADRAGRLPAPRLRRRRAGGWSTRWASSSSPPPPGCCWSSSAGSPTG